MDYVVYIDGIFAGRFSEIEQALSIISPVAHTGGAFLVTWEPFKGNPPERLYAKP